MQLQFCSKACNISPLLEVNNKLLKLQSLSSLSQTLEGGRIDATEDTLKSWLLVHNQQTQPPLCGWGSGGVSFSLTSIRSSLFCLSDVLSMPGNAAATLLNSCWKNNTPVMTTCFVSENIINSFHEKRKRGKG